MSECILQGSVLSVSIDIKGGSFGENNQLEQSDYSAPASAVNITTFSHIPQQDDQCIQVEIDQQYHKYLLNSNLNGRSQFRYCCCCNCCCYHCHYCCYLGSGEIQLLPLELILCGYLEELRPQT